MHENAELRSAIVRGTALFTIFAATLCFPAFAQSHDPGGGSRIVVLGEVQGAVQTVTDLLQKMELVDGDGHWSGGNATLIQTGDLMDGGVAVRDTLDLFMNLQKEAPVAGGEVIVLLGNHEAMNILGELRDVNYLAYETFAGPASETRQREAYEAHVAWRKQRAEAVGGESFAPDQEYEEEWLAVHPVGWVEYVEAMGPDGRYGIWLRTLPVAVSIDGVLFIHAGISPTMKGMTVEEINRVAAEELSNFDEDRARMAAENLCLPLASAREMAGVAKEEILSVNGLAATDRNTGNPRVARALELQPLLEWGSWSVLSDKGPLWFRGAYKWTGKKQESEMEEILDASQVRRMVTGQSDGKTHEIQARF
ncbi:MAG: metallophosphoesterase, partial [Acidobacteriota bacterium]